MTTTTDNEAHDVDAAHVRAANARDQLRLRCEELTAERDALRSLLAAAARGEVTPCPTCAVRLATRETIRGDTAPRYVVVPLADADEAERLREALRFLCRADVERCWFCGATATKRSPSTSWWCDVCAPPDAVDHEHAATLRPLLPPRGGAK